ncbi:MAG TPA: biotin--[acetyl-CoA-carboxylase] ligase [Oscillospiraceae bacterium]|nr:biotin--[acetyl-CoA-carboxylase] ligase [Oscillospiraceae bacterium]
MTKEEVLNYLRNTSNYVSGEELSEKLGISRSAIWKSINSLRESGYVIESATNRGYKLVSVPDALTEQEILNGLKTSVIGKTVYAYETIDSTNNEAKRQAQAGAPHGSIFVAEHQTDGKGRLGRTWSSPEGAGIAVTILLRPDASPLSITNITLLTGLAICNAIRAYTGCDAKIKWPNDIVIGGKKVCGILTEMAAEIDRIEYVVVGSGINVNNASFPEELSIKATSLFIESNHEISRVKLLQAILQKFERLLLEYNTQDDAAMLADYKKSCVNLGKKISITRNQKQICGTATDITPTGELLMICDDGTKLEINSGEVTVQGIYGEKI